jgi:hypothetical protein
MNGKVTVARVCRRRLQLSVASIALVALPALAHAHGEDDAAHTRLELELAGDLGVALGHHCHPRRGPDDDTVECGDMMILPGGGLSALLRPVDHFGVGIAGSAGRSLGVSGESALALYRVAVEGRGYWRAREAGGVYAALQLGVAWLDPDLNRADSAPTVSLGVGHAWSMHPSGPGIALALTGTLAFFGDYETSRTIRYGTLSFVTLSVRLSYGTPL